MAIRSDPELVLQAAVRVMRWRVMVSVGNKTKFTDRLEGGRTVADDFDAIAYPSGKLRVLSRRGVITWRPFIFEEDANVLLDALESAGWQWTVGRLKSRRAVSLLRETDGGRFLSIIRYIPADDTRAWPGTIVRAVLDAVQADEASKPVPGL